MKLAAENDTPAGTMDLQIELGRAALVRGLEMAGVPKPVAAALVDQAIVELQEQAAPHITAPRFELHGLGGEK
jgi:hypothetical protein